MKFEVKGIADTYAEAVNFLREGRVHLFISDKTGKLIAVDVEKFEIDWEDKE